MLLIFFVFPLISYGQKLPDYGFDKIRIVGADEIIQADIIQVSSTPSAKPNRFYYWFSGNTIHATQGGFSGTLLNGSYNEYYLDKSLKAQGTYKKGLKEGVWRSWNQNGILTEQYTWDEGLRSGKYELFDEQGNLKESGKYKGGVLVVKSGSFWQKLNVFRKKK